jgi:diguanylate cyclase (GGDEF)-like protein
VPGRGANAPGGPDPEPVTLSNDLSNDPSDTLTVRRSPFAREPTPVVDEARSTQPVLLVIRGLNVGETFALGAEERVLGRGPKIDFDLPDDSVSRRHASIRVEEGAPTLRDLGSRNGTFVNGKRVEGAVRLAEGDKIQVSPGTILKLTYADRQDETFQRRMYETSLRDPLTLAFNRRYFLDRLDRELRFARRHAQPISVILLDVDGLAAVNERLGLTAGDAVLADLARRVHALVRHEDVVARTGGDELAVLLRSTTAAAAATIAERIRAAVADESAAEGTRVTVSGGVAVSADGSGEPIQLLGLADAALAQARAAGRNRIHIYG